NRLDCKRRRGGFEGAPERFREGGGLRIEEQCDPFKSRRKLLEQGQPFPDNVLLEGGETGNVAARPCQARNHAASDRIGDAVGIGGLACRNSRAPCVAPVTIRSGERPISSWAYALSRAVSAPAQRSSMRRLRPSVQPNA